MKKLFFTSCFLCLLSTVIFSQSSSKTPITVFYYALNVDEAFQAELRDADEMLGDWEQVFQGKNPLVEGIIDETYQQLALALNDSTQYELLPITILKETEGKNILYTPRGYPVGMKKRAITHNTSELYAFIHVDVLMRAGSKTNTDLGAYKAENKKIRPGVRIVMRIFDAEGNKVAKYNVMAKTKSKVVIQTRMVLDWFKVGDDRRLEDSDNQTIIAKLVDEAVEMLIQEMQGE